jgi:acetyltransferase-like isoleucine patch superfamily enzyme
MPLLATALESVIRRIRPHRDGAELPDIGRLLDKGLLPMARGAAWSVFLRNAGRPILVGKSVRILGRRQLHTGHGVYIGDWSYIDCYSRDGVHLGDRVTLREWCWIQVTSGTNARGSGIWIGDDTYVAPRVNLGAQGPLVIGKRCMIGNGTNFIAQDHVVVGSDTSVYDSGTTSKGITVGDDSWIGVGVVILDGVTIGEGAIVGAGAVVTKDVEAYTVVAGIPARLLYKRDERRTEGTPVVDP